MGKNQAKLGIAFLFTLIMGLLGGWLFVNRKKSTEKLARLHGWRIWDFLHSYIYLKWTASYVKLTKYVLEHPHVFPKWLYWGAGNRLMQTHHSKVITTETARRLIDVKEPIVIKNPEQVLPFEMARDVILKNSEHIVVTDCVCRKAAENPCQPIDVCLYLSEPFADFLIEHKKDNARRIDVDEALEILEREHKRGRVHTAWFKNVLGNRLYAICNCCSCCCQGLRAIPFGFEVVVSSGYTARVDEGACALCGDCVSACQFGAIAIADSVKINEDKCKGCGICTEICPSEAIELQKDDRKPRPLVLP